MPIERTGMSERDYARHAGISRGAIRNARAGGRLVLLPDGSIDAAASDARRCRWALSLRNTTTPLIGSLCRFPVDGG